MAVLYQVSHGLELVEGSREIPWGGSMQQEAPQLRSLQQSERTCCCLMPFVLQELGFGGERGRVGVVCSKLGFKRREGGC